VVAQVVLVLLFTYFGFGALWHALTKTQKPQLVEPDQPLVRPFLGMTESSIILASLIVLFGAFVLVQVRYFFGGGANISAEGYTYAEYARRGFFELVVVALFTWLVHYGLSSFTRRESRRERTTFTLLGVLLLLLTGVILVSAFQRLSLYEAAYGFTRDRLVAHIFMIFIGLALIVSIILEATRGLKHMALSLLVGLLAFSLTLTFVNVDATIARQNLEHAMAGHPLDAAYLAGMTISEDAVPELFRFFDSDKLSPELYKELGNVISCRRGRYWDLWFYDRFWASQHASRAKALGLYLAHEQALDPFALIGYQDGAGYIFPDGKVICVYPPEE
jgi:hydrogenase-4 membrane subunit HyfE